MGIIRKLRRSKAQSIMEYTTLVIIASTAVGFMVLHIQRAMDVRFRHLDQELNESER
jgi:hypothetical protein|tara:strand:- start:396 stop:566 length:171 start_codon:yes stop_codon:yes gene_type:complete